MTNALNTINVGRTVFEAVQHGAALEADATELNALLDTLDKEKSFDLEAAINAHIQVVKERAFLTGWGLARQA